MVLLLSALLTAGYLLPISLQGFLPGEGVTPVRRQEPSWQMLLPIALTTLAALLLGIFTKPLISALAAVLA